MKECGKETTKCFVKNKSEKWFLMWNILVHGIWLFVRWKTEWNECQETKIIKNKHHVDFIVTHSFRWINQMIDKSIDVKINCCWVKSNEDVEWSNKTILYHQILSYITCRYVDLKNGWNPLFTLWKKQNFWKNVFSLTHPEKPEIFR